jgi:hypothetical protein
MQDKFIENLRGQANNLCYYSTKQGKNTERT